jgi:hypothetical protein
MLSDSTHRKGVRDLDLDRYLGEESLQNSKKNCKTDPYVHLYNKRVPKDQCSQLKSITKTKQSLFNLP